MKVKGSGNAIFYKVEMDRQENAAGILSQRYVLSVVTKLIA